MFLGCQPSLDPSVISQVENWKNVPKEVKSKFMKGFSAQNIVSYALVDNLGGTLRFVGGKANISCFMVYFQICLFE